MIDVVDTKTAEIKGVPAKRQAKKGTKPKPVHLDWSQEREFRLKAVQAWSDLTQKIILLAGVANGALLTTAASFIKEKGVDIANTTAVKASLLGLAFSTVAFLVLWLLSSMEVEQLASPSPGKYSLHGKISLGTWAVLILLGFSSACFVSAVAFFVGWSDALLTL